MPRAPNILKRLERAHGIGANALGKVAGAIARRKLAPAVLYDNAVLLEQAAAILRTVARDMTDEKGS